MMTQRYRRVQSARDRARTTGWWRPCTTRAGALLRVEQARVIPALTERRCWPCDVPVSDVVGARCLTVEPNSKKAEW
jgi:hypothetical protein